MVQASNSPEQEPEFLPEQHGEQASQPEQAQPASEAPAEQHEQVTGGERRAEQQMEAADRDDNVVLPQVAADDDDTDDDQGQPAQAQSQSVSSMPAVADDVDVIEKAWVDKAKQIIQDTKDDPHAQEAEFEKLQIEYHKKRYGRDIKATR